MADPTGNEPPGVAPDEERNAEQKSEADDEEPRVAPDDGQDAEQESEADDEEPRVPGDWQDVKRYLIGLLSLVFVAVLLMFVVAVYEYHTYAGSKAEDTKMTPAQVHKLEKNQLPVVPSSR